MRNRPIFFCCVYDDGGFSGATTDRSALQRLRADITAGRASAIRSAPSSPTSPLRCGTGIGPDRDIAAFRPHIPAPRVSLPTQATRPGPDNRGKPRFLDLERRIPARDRFAPDSQLEGDGFELPVREHRAMARATDLPLPPTVKRRSGPKGTPNKITIRVP